MFEEFEDGLIKKGNIDNTKEMIPQGTIDWMLLRIGMFTCSRIPDLMKTSRGGKGFGAPALSYINEKAVERMLTEDGKLDYIARNSRGGAASSWGIDNEDWARSLFSEITHKIIDETEFLNHPNIPYFGGSSDGRIQGESAIIEIKNPYDPTKHMANMLMCRSGAYPENGEYYGQIQANIEIAGVDGCYFISGDKRNKTPIVWVYVPRDEEYISVMLKRLEEAESMVQDLLNEVNFNLS